MIVGYILLALVLMLVLSLMAQPISRCLRMHYASILVVLGFLTSELIVYAGIDTRLRADNFQVIIFYVFIPVLVFESAYNIDKNELINNIIIILFLAIIAMILTCLIVAVLLSYGIGPETGFPWMVALITGAILAATDPITLALALSLPTSLDYWWTIQSITFGVVMFSLFVQAPTVQFLAAKLSIKAKGVDGKNL